MYTGWCLEVFIYCASAGGDLNDPYLHSLTCWDVLYILRSLSEIPCNPSPNLWLPKTSQIHGQGALEVLLSFTTVAKLEDCSYLEMAWSFSWSFSTTSLPKKSMSFDLFLNFQCLQILSIYIMHLRKILPWNPHQWFFECPNFQPVFRETFPFFQFPNSFVVGLVYTVQVYPPIVFFTNLTTKLSPKLFSQHRMICLIILLHLRMPRWDRFWSWTRDFLKMDLTWEVAIHPALNEVVQLYEEFLA